MAWLRLLRACLRLALRVLMQRLDELGEGAERAVYEALGAYRHR